MKLMVYGSDSIRHKNTIRDELRTYKYVTEYVAGDRNTVDKIVESVSTFDMIPLTVFNYKHSSITMSKYADEALIFWDGKCPVTESAIEYALTNCDKVTVMKIE